MEFRYFQVKLSKVVKDKKGVVVLSEMKLVKEYNPEEKEVKFGLCEYDKHEYCKIYSYTFEQGLVIIPDVIDCENAVDENYKVFVNQLENKFNRLEDLVDNPVLQIKVECQDGFKNAMPESEELLNDDNAICFIFTSFLNRFFESSDFVERYKNIRKTNISNYIFYKMMEIYYLKRVVHKEYTSKNNTYISFLESMSKASKDWFVLSTDTNDERINLHFVDASVQSKGKECRYLYFSEDIDEKNTNFVKWPLTREESIDFLIFDSINCSTKDGYMHVPLRDLYLSAIFKTSGLEAYDQSMNSFLEYTAGNWYLKKYDVKKAKKIYSLFPTKNIGNKLETSFKSLFQLIKYPLFLLIVFFTLTFFDWSFNKKIILLPLEYLKIFQKWFLPATQITIIVIIICRVKKYARKFISSSTLRSGSFNVEMPRLLAAILLGYIPLIWSNDIVRFILAVSYRYIIVIGSICVFVSYVYILIEVSNNLEKHIPFNVFIARVNRIYIGGLLRSAIIGIFLLDIFSEFTLSYTNQNPVMLTGHGDSIYAFEYTSSGNPMLYGIELKPLSTLFLNNHAQGVVYLKLLIAFIPMAFMLGLVLQILWEDKEITSPL